MEWTNVITKVWIDGHGEGPIRTIGALKFNPTHLHLGFFSTVYLAVDRIEINAFCQQTERVQELQQLGVVVGSMGTLLDFIDSKMAFYARVRTGELGYCSNLSVPIKPQDA